jgi:hypothetical protein
MPVKLYESDGPKGKRASAESRYSPARCTGTQTQRIAGDPDERHISMSYVERQNLTMRMSMRRFTRVINAFSEKSTTLRRCWPCTTRTTTSPGFTSRSA